MNRIDVGAARAEHTIERLEISVDRDDVTTVADLVDSTLGPEEASVLSVYSVGAAGWLKLSLTAPGSVRKSNCQLKRSGGAQLKLECTDRAAVLADPAAVPASLVLELAYRVGAESSTHKIIIRSVVFTTRELPETEVTAQTGHEVTVSRHVPADAENIEVGTLLFVQGPPESPLRYRGADLQVKAEVSAIVKSPAELAGTEIATSLTTSSETIQADAQNNMFLPQGNPIQFVCELHHADLYKNAEGAASLEVQLLWEYRITRSDRNTSEEKKIKKPANFLVALRQNEFVVVKWKDRAPIVPLMTPEGDVLATAKSQLNVNCSRDQVDPDALKLDLNLTRLVREVKTLRLTTRIDGAGHRMNLPEIVKDITFDSADLAHRIELDTLFTLDNIAALPETFSLVVMLTTEIDGREVSGGIRVPVAVHGNMAEYAYCMDFGGSATAIWCGKIAERTQGAFLPLGDWAFQRFGSKAEYNAAQAPLGNILLPTIIGLNSKRHLRSARDKLSLGLLDRVGFDVPAVEKRLTQLCRRFDISIPAEDQVTEVKPRKSGGERPAVFRDFKRRLMEERTMMCEQIYENRQGRLSQVDIVEPRDILSSLFDELADASVLSH